MTALVDSEGLQLDLTQVAFTAPGSRLLVLAGEAGGLKVASAQYERGISDSLLLRRLTVVDAGGRPLPVSSALPHRIEFAGGAATLGFSGPDALSVGGDPELTVAYETASGQTGRHRLGAGWRFSWSGPGLAIAQTTRHEADLESSRAAWAEWFARRPRVRPDLQAMTDYCWWVLGANIVHLGVTGNARAVVPSKLGYVALWQWDAYFIAVGLRHGDPGLAREQISLALQFPSPDGQLPDVVHDEGVLASSDDLPPGDQERLRERGSAASGARVPLTKPPLTAWAAQQVFDADPDEAWLSALLPTLLASQDWWFAASDSDHDGLPEYAHPYSSGLDDSPVFDGPLPVTTPDLAAYLIRQDELLAGWLDARDPAAAARCRARADATFAQLLELWDPAAGVFRSRDRHGQVPAETVLGLMPLLTGRLPADVVEALLAALDDPDRHATQWPVSTVASVDPSFDPDAMWRGPVWLNTNRLLIEGLAASGHPERARELTERTLAMVAAGGGPHEYFNPHTAAKPERAVTMFSWTAALYVDLAVRASGQALR